jgi:RHS repeat-associated protein
MPHRRRTLRERLEALLLVLVTLSWGACIPPTALAPYPGVLDSARMGFVAVPGGAVNTAGGNLLLSRLDLSLDTPLGTQEMRAVYNSATGEWRWGFQVTYDGTTFVDPSGAVFEDVTPEGGLLTPNGTLPGTHWVRVDASTMRTKGGLAYHFDAQGALAYVSWATLDYPRIRFTPGLVSQCLLASTCTPLFQMSLNADGQPLVVTDARTGRSASFSYDGLGRLETAQSPSDLALGRPGTRYEYETGGTLLIAIVSSEGERIEYDYQAGRRLLHVTQVGEGDPRHRFEFYGEDPDLARWTTVHTNPLGGETRYLYDNVGRLREVERDAGAEVTRIRYAGTSLAAALRPASITTPAGARTRFTVSADDDVTQVIEPSGNVVSLGYAPGAVWPDRPLERPPARIEDSVGLVSETSYGADGRPVAMELPEGEMTSATWQGAFAKTLTDPAGITTTFNSYGIHGHWIDASVPSTYFPVRRAFDPVGNLLVSAAGLQDGGVLDRSYDEDRHVRNIHVAASEAGHVTAEDDVVISRRSDGQPLAVQRPLGADHAFVYDALGRLTLLRERVDGAWHDTSFEYDAAGHLTARERPNGMREERGYDAYGRLVRRTALRDGVLEGELLVSWAAALPASAWDSKRGVTETYTYDAAGRLAAVAYSSGETASLAYDARSRVTEVTYRVPGQPDHSVGTEYDAADHQTRVLVDGSEAVARFFYANGRPVRVETGNGLVRQTLYDAASGRISGFSTTDAQGVVESTSVTRTVDSERFLTQVFTTTPLGTTRENYSMGLAGLLGDVDRRVGNRVWGWDDGEGGAKTYVYDGLSNLMSNPDGDTFVYNAERNRLMSATLAHEGESVTYAYDEAGFVTSRGGTPLTWTATGRLASYGDVSIEWDMADRPISMTVAGITRSFARFGGAVETDPATGAVLGVDLGVAQVSFASSARLYRHLDFRGNVSFVSDETGAVVAHYRYSAYGVDQALGAPGADGRRFAGRLELSDGLVLMGARIYDPLVGRFFSQDPVFQALNAYSYTLGNPLDFWDPDGSNQEVRDATTDVAVALFLVAFAAGGVIVAIGAAAGSGGILTGSLVLAGGAFGLSLYELQRKLKTLDRAVRALEKPRTTPVDLAPGQTVAEIGELGGLDLFGDGPCTSRCGPGGPGPPPPPSWPEGVQSSCAPADLPMTPNLGPLLTLLLPLQLVLAGAALRSRRRRLGKR